MTELNIALPAGKKLYFASDFHLGVPDSATSIAREKRIVQWLDTVKHDAHSIFLLGDIFDFWFEYKRAIPRGFIRLQGKLAELRDAGMPIYFFTGNHDMWMFDYFPTELGIPVYRDLVKLNVTSTNANAVTSQPSQQIIQSTNQQILLGHGDGLGPGDHTYKILKKFFNSRVCQWLFARLHPNFGMAIANKWSKSSRIANMKREENFKHEDNEFLLTWCKETEAVTHHDYYVFGHRHLPLDLKVGENSRYVNTGEWVHFNSYAEFENGTLTLKNFEAK